MANPKKRTSSSRRNSRRSHQRLQSLPNISCSNCQEPKLRHHVCPHCGHYKGQAVIETKWE